MQVSVRLHDILKGRAAGVVGRECGLVTREVAAGSTVADLLDQFGFDEELVGLVTVNGRQAGKDIKLQDGDSVALFSPMSGG